MPASNERIETRRKVWIDCSLTVRGRFHTGVQRVVRLICRESLFGNHRDDFAFQPVVALDDRFWIAVMDDSNASTLRVSNQTIRWFDDISSRLPKLYRRVASSICERLRIPTLRRWLLPMPGHLGMFRIPARIAKRFSKDPPPTPAPIQAGDIILLPDSYWSRFSNWDAIEAAKASGAKLFFVLYDLIPYTHAELYDHKEVQAFRHYIERLVELADGVFAISETVAQEFRVYLSSYHASKSKTLPVESFPLGAEIGFRDGFVRSQLKSKFQPLRARTPYLMVGSIEVRKNHHYAIDAMELVWKQYPEVELVIVGRTGWQGRPVVDRIKNHPQYNKRLYLLHDVTDAELNYCYANSRGILFPSLTEGFGLPIVEALWHGSQPFVSDIPSHREVGKDACFYCDVTSPATLAQLLIDWESKWKGNRPVVSKQQNVLGWNESFRVLSERLRLMIDQHNI